MAITHDPGRAGPSGEGTASVVCMCLVYLAALGLLCRTYLKKYRGYNNEDNTASEIELKDRSAADVKKDGSAADASEDDAIGDDDAKDTDELLAWTEPAPYYPTVKFRESFVYWLSFGMVSGNMEDPGSSANSTPFKVLYWFSGVNWTKAVLLCFVVFLIWLFLVSLGLMGVGFKLIGGKDSAKMFDIVDNPISGLMIGILATVLVQSSSTSTSIIVGLVGADELSVNIAIPMIMGANIGTSVTNTIVAMGHFHNARELRRGFAGATVHDCFNLLSVLIMLPIQWASNFLGLMTYAMAKDADVCQKDVDDCEKTEFLKPFISPYIKGVASYNKKVATSVAHGYCTGQCADSASSAERQLITDYICSVDKNGGTPNCDNIEGFKRTWIDDDLSLKVERLPAYIQFIPDNNETSGLVEYHYTCPFANNMLGCTGIPSFWNSTSNSLTVEATSAIAANEGILEVCHKMKYGLCDKPLLKGGLMLTEWHLDDKSAGALSVVLSVAAICCILYLVVQSLTVLVKGHAAKALRWSVRLNGYLSILMGCFITVMVQSSSITTSVMTPLVAVGLISLEDMFPLTLGANIGTCITGILAATVVTSNPVEAWQVALCHLFFNIFGIAIWYPIPFMRNVPLSMARKLGQVTKRFPWFPIPYVITVFFLIPGIAYFIMNAVSR